MKIPVTVITGFLGAGKTTLIRHLLQNADGRRIALIVNEFGSVGVDGEILAACGVEGCTDEDDIIELANGCICCTVADDFLPTMQKLLGRDLPPEHVIIETSGLALPQPLVRAMAWPEVRTKVTVDGVVTVVDGAAMAEGRFAADEAAVEAQRAADEALDHETPLSELFEDQLACADLIVVNKSDLLAGGAAAALETRLKNDVRDGVAVIRAERGEVSPAVALGMNVAAEEAPELRAEKHHRHDHDHHHHDHDHHDDHDHHHHDHVHDHHHDHGHDAFHSIAAACGEVSDPAALERRVCDIAKTHGLYRVKGFAAVAGKPMRLVVQAVGPRVESYFDQPWPAGAKRASRFVAIGPAGADWAAVAADLQKGA